MKRRYDLSPNNRLCACLSAAVQPATVWLHLHARCLGTTQRPLQVVNSDTGHAEQRVVTVRSEAPHSSCT